MSIKQTAGVDTGLASAQFPDDPDVVRRRRNMERLDLENIRNHIAERLTAKYSESELLRAAWAGMRFLDCDDHVDFAVWKSVETALAEIDEAGCVPY